MDETLVTELRLLTRSRDGTQTLDETLHKTLVDTLQGLCNPEQNGSLQ